LSGAILSDLELPVTLISRVCHYSMLNVKNGTI